MVFSGGDSCYGVDVPICCISWGRFMLWRGYKNLLLMQYFKHSLGEIHAMAWTHRPVVKAKGHTLGLPWGRLVLWRGRTDPLLRQ